METEKMSVTITEISTVPYLGLPECKDCQQRMSEVVEQRIHADTGEVVFDTHLQCRKLPFCKNLKEHWMAQTRNQIINGSGKKTVGISRAEPPADD